MKYRAVFFDLDGTFCDTALDLTFALNQLLKEEGQAPVHLSQVRTRVSHGTSALIQLAFPQLNDESRLIDLRQRLLTAYQQHLYVHTRLYPGIEEIIEQLDRQSIPWGIVTNKPFALAQQLMAGLNLQWKHHVLLGGDSLAYAKPHPAPLLHAAQLCHKNPSDCCYIGDHHRDIQSACAAQMTSIAVTYGYLNLDDNPSEWGADFVLDSPLELAIHLGVHQ